MTIAPELGEASPRQIDHLLEPSKPVAWSAMMPLNASRARLGPHQLVLRQNGGIGAPRSGVLHGHLPVGKAVHHLRERGSVTTATCPVEQSTCTSIQRLPALECVTFVLRSCHATSPLTPTRRLFPLALASHNAPRKSPDPVRHRLGRDAPSGDPAMHREPTQIEPYR
jgi:hypothetical protein